MKAIMVMFDTLNRRMLPPYGCDWVHAPNFARLAGRAATFDNAYVGSMPCMPARRELHTGRYNFLHRSWGPIEPFDDSMPEILKQHGVHTHLASDHYHYWEEGGCNYHTRYSTWESARGQEGEPWKGDLRPVKIPENVTGRNDHWFRQDVVNRKYMPHEEDQPQAKTFCLGLDFMRANAGEDNWFLHIETFDPHEPFYTQAHYKALYPHEYHGRHFDWPSYERVCQTPEEIEHCRMEYAALVSMCDHYLGQLLDAMDELGLWDDTLLIVNTDHGFLLGEHDWWAKCVQPFYNEVAHTPLFIWDPRCRAAGVRRSALVQTIDLAPTLLEYFGIDRPADMQGHPLAETIAADAPVREAALFGLFGSQVNVTDGRYVYMRGPANAQNLPLFEYTLMPAHMRRTFGVDELQDISLAGPFPFTKGCRTLRIAGRAWPVDPDVLKTLLFDLQSDPGQLQPLADPAVEQRMIDLLVRLMAENDAPAEQYARLGVPTGAPIGPPTEEL
jgi:arylsulfatase A-like enzyme